MGPVALQRGTNSSTSFNTPRSPRAKFPQSTGLGPIAATILSTQRSRNSCQLWSQSETGPPDASGAKREEEEGRREGGREEAVGSGGGGDGDGGRTSEAVTVTETGTAQTQQEGDGGAETGADEEVVASPPKDAGQEEAGADEEMAASQPKVAGQPTRH